MIPYSRYNSCDGTNVRHTQISRDPDTFDSRRQNQLHVLCRLPWSQFKHGGPVNQQNV